ncbi:MAG: hypothetical protein J1E62_07170 [Lachnospiraceae bacterium]|nr:hypothetical protein [Lachnospiraceae bacterium]
MKIKGSLNYVIFDLENGYSIKAEGEMLTGRKLHKICHRICGSGCIELHKECSEGNI